MWDEFGSPVSVQYGDRFYSADGGLEESRHVFLRGNGLPEAWQERSQFVIAELGFGTGLNFLLTLKLWRETAQHGRLFFLSCESSPLSSELFARALSAWPELENERDELLRLLPMPIIGTHVLQFDGGVTLLLSYNDVSDALAELSGPVDAWYLDGFAPGKNPRMWDQEVFKHIRRLSVRGTSAATYSVSSSVRSGLEAIGFEIEKRPGFGRKREMLVARAVRNRERPPETRPRSIAVIGSGLAGTAVCYALLKRGCSVTLIEQDEEPPQRASGNAAGVLMPHVSARPDLMSRFYLEGFEFTLRLLEQFRKDGMNIAGELGGVVRLVTSERLQKVFAALEQMAFPPDFLRGLSQQEASELTGIEMAAAALYFPTGGWISPRELCRWILETSPRLIRRFSKRVVGIERRGSGWQVLGPQETVVEAEAVIFCGGYESLEIPQTHWLPVERVRGQAMQVDETNESSRLKQVVCYDGYLCPADRGLHSLGATYDHENDDTEASELQNEDLFRRLRRWVPGMKLEYRGGEKSRVSFRTMSRDRLPICGALAELDAFERNREAVSKKTWEKSGLLPNFYVNVGHGSRGLISCLLCGELLAAELNNEPLPLERDLVQALHPSRFLARLVSQGLPLTDENVRSLKVPHLR